MPRKKVLTSMTCMKKAAIVLALASTLMTPVAQAAAPKAMKTAAASAVDAQAKQIQVMVDQVFSYAEPGFQEVKTSEYLTAHLERYGFNVTRRVAGIPKAFTPTWGSGGPATALGREPPAEQDRCQIH